jgi:23S rRNA (cytosine1962-C5)-methyltransferase
MNETISEICITKKSADYELLDSGAGRKLERFGDFVLSRPDPQALWRKSLSESEWLAADATFEQTSGRGKWHNKKPFPESWQISLGGITFLLKPSVFKHIGVFPEQQGNWKWVAEKIGRPDADVAGALSTTLAGSAPMGSSPFGSSVADIAVLNLFASTGGATLAAALAGASVCHVDSSQFAIDCAVANRDASGLSETPIRFIVDDVKKFVEREIRRGQKYDIIILDPPVYGKGTKKEIWNLEDDLAPLLSQLPKLLSEKPLAVLLSGYASGLSHITYAQVIADAVKNLNGKISSGELGILQSDSDRILPAGIFARCEF